MCENSYLWFVGQALQEAYQIGAPAHAAGTCHGMCAELVEPAHLPPLQVNIKNADTGVEVQNSDFVTIQGLTFDFSKPRGSEQTGEDSGHHGMWSAASSNVHFTDFIYSGRFIHDLTLDVFSEQCVSVLHEACCLLPSAPAAQAPHKPYR